MGIRLMDFICHLNSIWRKNMDKKDFDDLLQSDAENADKDVSLKDVPDIKTTIILPDGCALPIEDVDSNLHELDLEYTNEINHARLAMDGRVYARDGKLTHDQHEAVHFKGWHFFARNTALKSVSADKNVD
jgi:hypothetical protein